MFNWRVVDCDLAIGLCTLLSKAEVFKILWKVIDNTWQNYDKILVCNMIVFYIVVKQLVYLFIIILLNSIHREITWKAHVISN